MTTKMAAVFLDLHLEGQKTLKMAVCLDLESQKTMNLAVVGRVSDDGRSCRTQIVLKTLMHTTNDRIVQTTGHVSGRTSRGLLY